MIEPPNPGIPQSTIDTITRLVWRDTHLVDAAGDGYCLVVDSGQWYVSSSGLYKLTAVTWARIRNAQARTDGSFVADDGKNYVLDRVRFTDGSLFAVSAPV